MGNSFERHDTSLLLQMGSHRGGRCRGDCKQYDHCHRRT